MQVVVLLMTGGNDTIADSTEVDVGLCLNNQVTMDISPKKVKYATLILALWVFLAKIVLIEKQYATENISI